MQPKWYIFSYKPKLYFNDITVLDKCLSKGNNKLVLMHEKCVYAYLIWLDMFTHRNYMTYWISSIIIQINITLHLCPLNSFQYSFFFLFFLVKWNFPKLSLWPLPQTSDIDLPRILLYLFRETASALSLN